MTILAKIIYVRRRTGMRDGCVLQEEIFWEENQRRLTEAVWHSTIQSCFVFAGQVKAPLWWTEAGEGALGCGLWLSSAHHGALSQQSECWEAAEAWLEIVQSVWECSTLISLGLGYSVTSTVYELFYMEFLKLRFFVCVYKDVKTVFCTTVCF